MSTSRAVLLLFGVVMSPMTLGIAGFKIGGAAGSVLGFILGCLPAALLWRRTPRTDYPTHDVGDAGFWVSDDSSHGHEASWESGGGDSGGGGADGGGGGD